MHRSSPFLAVAACLVAFAQAHAQDTQSVMDSSVGLTAERESLVGGGAHYRATFDDEGLVFTPALGSRAKRVYPTKFRMRTIVRDGEVVASSTGRRPTMTGTTAVYDHGRGVVERYHVRPRGVEVTYTFDRKPAGKGDLKVLLAIDTELRLAGLKAGGAIAMHAGDLGGISIGTVTGIDARGRRVQGKSRIVDGQLELTLPAAFVEGASYPMVLDPLIGTDFPIGHDASNDQFGDVAYSLDDRRYLVVWQRSFGGVNIEIRGQLISRTGSKIGRLIQFTNSSMISVGPAVGYVRKTNRFLVAWQRAASLNGNWDIVCRSVDPSDGSLSAVAGIATSAAAETHVDVGSDRTEVDDEAIVVYAHGGTGIRSRQITVPANGAPSPFGVSKTVTSDANDRRPSISKSGGNARHYMVVFERRLRTSRWSIMARSLDQDSFPRGAEKSLSSSVTRDLTRPRVDGDGTRFMAVWQRQESSVSTNHDIRGRIVRWNGTEIVLETGQLVLEAGVNDDETEPDVAYLRHKFAVVWTDLNGTNKRAIGLKMFCTETGVLTDSTVGLGGPHSNNVHASICPRYAGGSVTDQGFVAFTSQDPSAGLKGNLRGQIVAALGDGGAVTNLGGGCGLGGTLSADGPCAIANSDFGLRLSGAAPAATTALLNLSPPAPPFVVCGGCQISNPTILFPRPISGGSGTARFAIPCDPQLVGVTLHWQFYVFGSGTTPCSAAGGVSFSNRLSTTIGR